MHSTTLFELFRVAATNYLHRSMQVADISTWDPPPNPSDDTAVLLCSLISSGSVGWSTSSSIPGDLVLRLQDQSRYLWGEILERGLKTAFRVSYDDVEVLVIDDGADGGVEAASLRPQAHQCPSCGENFGGSEALLSNHLAICSRFRRADASVGSKRGAQESYGAGLHLGLRRPPTFFREVEVPGDSFGSIAWVPFEHSSSADFTATGQLSFLLRDKEWKLAAKLKILRTLVSENRSKLLKYIEDHNGSALIGAAIVKSFQHHGYFRGVVRSYDDGLFAIRFVDGDSEDLTPSELHTLISSSLPEDSSGRRRRRRVFTGARPRSSSRVGDDYQAMVPSPTAGPEFEGSWELNWAPPDDTSKLEGQVRVHHDQSYFHRHHE